jgi:bifunctional non-homologous end joining protein LigD
VKRTCAQRETLTIAGFALDEGKWDRIYVGRRKGADLIYAGKDDHGFDKASAADLQKRLKPLIRKTQPYAKRASGSSPSCLPKSRCDDCPHRQIQDFLGAARVQ